MSSLTFMLHCPRFRGCVRNTLLACCSVCVSCTTRATCLFNSREVSCFRHGLSLALVVENNSLDYTFPRHSAPSERGEYFTSPLVPELAEGVRKPSGFDKGKIKRVQHLVVSTYSLHANESLKVSDIKPGNINANKQPRVVFISRSIASKQAC